MCDCPSEAVGRFDVVCHCLWALEHLQETVAWEEGWWGKDVWTGAFCLSAMGWCVWIVLIKTRRIGLCYIWVVFLRLLCSSTCQPDKGCHLPDSLLPSPGLAVLSKLLYLYKTPWTGLWLSWSEQNFPMNQWVKQDQTLFLQLLTEVLIKSLRSKYK